MNEGREIAQKKVQHLKEHGHIPKPLRMLWGLDAIENSRRIPWYSSELVGTEPVGRDQAIVDMSLDSWQRLHIPGLMYWESFQHFSIVIIELLMTYSSGQLQPEEPEAQNFIRKHYLR